MIKLAKALAAWNRPEFKDTLKFEMEKLDPQQLPLQQGLTTGSCVTDSKISIMIISVADEVSCVRVKAGIFYSSIIAGCNCADDPTPVDENNEYCEVLVTIDKSTAETTVTLATD